MNSPLNRIDLDGREDFLMCDSNPPSYPTLNYVKGGVGLVNIGRGARKMVTGVTELALGVPALVAGPGTGPLMPLEEAGACLATADGISELGGAYFLCKRGGQQCGEASVDPNLGHLRNLAGLLPFGSWYDDPGESIGDAWKKFKEAPLWHKIGEFFTF